MVKNNFDTPVLLLIFNRPAHTERQIASLRAVGPRRIYVSADGPRPDRTGEEELCERTRNILKTIDWECTVETNFYDHNLGCRLGVSGGITWFFEQVEYGIILEDDCIAEPGFFYFCAELLVKYKDDPRIMMIGANNPAPELFKDRKESYVLTKFSFIWGWASWRRAWAAYDLDMRDLENFRTDFYKKGFLKNRMSCDYLWEKFRVSKTGTNNTWDFQWFYSILKKNGLCIMPSVNLVENIGFGAESTHTGSEVMGRNIKATAMTFPLRHPVLYEETAPDINQQIFYKVYKSRWRLWMWSVLRKIWSGN